MFAIAIIFWLINLGFSLTSDVTISIERFKISELTVRLLQIAVAAPLLIIYFAIAAAGSSFMIYAMRIRSSPEGKAYGFLTSGVLVLFFGYMIQSLLSSYRTAKYTNIPTNELLPLDQVVTYLNIVITLGAFFFFFRGSYLLLRTLKDKQSIHSSLRLAALITGIIALFYVVLVFSNQYRTISVDPGIRPLYGVSDTLILFTIVIPNLFAWFLGLFAFFNLRSYAQKVKGAVFKDIFSRLKLGLSIIIFFYIFLQIIGQFSSSFKDASLNFILGLLAFLLIGLTVGFMQVSLAARKLDKIETA